MAPPRRHPLALLVSLGQTPRSLSRRFVAVDLRGNAGERQLFSRRSRFSGPSSYPQITDNPNPSQIPIGLSQLTEIYASCMTSISLAFLPRILTGGFTRISTGVDSECSSSAACSIEALPRSREKLQRLVDRLSAEMRARPPRGFSSRDVERFFAQNESAILEMAEQLVTSL